MKNTKEEIRPNRDKIKIMNRSKRKLELNCEKNHDGNKAKIESTAKCLKNEYFKF